MFCFGPPPPYRISDTFPRPPTENRLLSVRWRHVTRYVCQVDRPPGVQEQTPSLFFPTMLCGPSQRHLQGD